MKYIDTERLRARIEKNLAFDNSIDTAYYRGRRDAEWTILTLIDSLRQEKSAKCIEDSIEFKEGFKTGRETGLRDGQKYVLDNLEDYGLCKPAEWSKNDNVFLNEITDFFENNTIRLQHDLDMYAHWLKSLRPSWKPSENQMSMLLAVVNDPNNAGSASCHLSLKSLYNDLKKL